MYEDIRATILDFNTYVLAERGRKSKVLVMSFNTLPVVDLSKELRGESRELKKLALLSKDDDCTVLCGIRMLLSGKTYLSVAVAHKGKLIDIADRVACSDEDIYECTNRLKIYNSDAGRLGLLIDGDAELKRLWSKIIPLCDMVICISERNCRAKVRALNKELDFPALYVDTKTKFYLFAASFSDSEKRVSKRQLRRSKGGCHRR